jgi:hypothetical protein
VVWIRATARGERILHDARRRRVAMLAADLATLGLEELALLERAAAVLERVARGEAAGS